MEKLELPLGFAMALAQNEGAMENFERLSQLKKAAVWKNAAGLDPGGRCKTLSILWRRE